MYTYIQTYIHAYMNLLWWLSVKESPINAGTEGDADSIPGSGRSLGGESGNPLQYSCQKSPMDREAWWTKWGRRRFRHD